MLLRGWIWLSPIVDPLYLIRLLSFNTLTSCYSLESLNGTEVWTTCFEDLYSVYSKVYVLPVSPSWSVWVRVLCHENLLMISDKTFQCCFLRNGATHHSKSGNIIRMMSTTITSNIKQTCVTRNQNFFQKNHIDLEFQESIEKWG